MQPCWGGGHRRGKTSASAPSSTPTVPTTLCASSRNGSGPGSPGPKALDLLEWSRPTPSFVRPAEDMGFAVRRVHSPEDLADARRGAAFIEFGPHPLTRQCPHRCASHHRTVHRPFAGHRRRGRGGPGPERSGSTPPASDEPPACRQVLPAACGVADDRNPASTPAGRHRLAVQTAGRPTMCSSGCGHAGQTSPSCAAAATTRPSRPATGSDGSELPHRANHPGARTTPAVRPDTGGAKPLGVICCQVCITPQR
jgi:hypothetical protein